MSERRAEIEIDPNSGFCFGVVTAIAKAEEELKKSGRLYCLGDIVHNSDEVERLRRSGLVTITHEQFARLHDVKVLLRAHGEPPETYEIARRNNIEIIDATCPVVLRLQQRIKQTFDSDPSHPQIVIYGKIGHAEVNGLVGQTRGEAVVVEHLDQLSKVDLTHDIAGQKFPGKGFAVSEYSCIFPFVTTSISLLYSERSKTPSMGHSKESCNFISRWQGCSISSGFNGGNCLACSAYCKCQLLL